MPPSLQWLLWSDPCGISPSHLAYIGDGAESVAEYAWAAKGLLLPTGALVCSCLSDVGGTGFLFAGEVVSTAGLVSDSLAF